MVMPIINIFLGIYFVETTDSHIFWFPIKVLQIIACRELDLKVLVLRLDASNEQGNY